ncbi:MAG: ROK family protein [Acidobacteriota bacterium]|nr:ROK family protein [Acidobacteriota bacterium]
MPSFAIGVDLGGTNLRVAAVDDSGKLLEKVTSGTEVGKGRDQVIQDMTTVILELAMKFQHAGKLAGIGVGVPGIIDMRTGMLRESPNLPGWHDYPVRDEIERRLKAPVILENDANAAALGESWLGAARDYDSMCMLTLGTGVGGGIVLNGEVWRGMTGMAGELGHINVDPEGHACGCGSRGCIEQYASATAITRMAKDAIAAGSAAALQRVADGNVEFSAKSVYLAAVQGDEPARLIFLKVGWALGIVIADLVNIFNAPMYVIGGGVSSSWEAFAPAMFEETRKRSFVYRATNPAEKPAIAGATGATIITRALLGSDAGLYGAARLPLTAGLSERKRTA